MVRHGAHGRLMRLSGFGRTQEGEEEGEGSRSPPSPMSLPESERSEYVPSQQSDSEESDEEQSESEDEAAPNQSEHEAGSNQSSELIQPGHFSPPSPFSDDSGDDAAENPREKPKPDSFDDLLAASQGGRRGGGEPPESQPGPSQGKPACKEPQGGPQSGPSPARTEPKACSAEHQPEERNTAADHAADQHVPGIERGPSGDKWRRLDGKVACPCGMVIDITRVSRHIKQLCKLNPCPLADIREHVKGTCTWMRVSAESRTTCPICEAKITATGKTTMAKSIGTHISKKHRDLSSRKRQKLRHKVFRHNYVLVASTIQTAVAAGLKLDCEAYDKVAKSRKRHGTSRAQATAPSREESREEHLLRSSTQLHPEPHPLFLVQGLFTSTANPSRSTRSFLMSLEKEMELNVPDWRYVFAVSDARRRLRGHLNDTYAKSPDKGFMTANSLRKFVKFVRGHLAELQDGEDWRQVLEMTRELIEAVIKENSNRVIKARGEREVRHMGESQLQHPDRVLLQRTVIKHMTEKRNQPMPETLGNTRKLAVWFRQAAYIALSVCLGQRTGVFQNLTVQEFREAVETSDGIVINHVGGKTRGTYKTVQIPISHQLHELITWYTIDLQRTLGRSEESSKLLLPHLNPFDTQLMDLKIPEIQHLDYPRLLRGNRTRRYHVQLTHQLDEDNRLKGTTTRELAALRCHSEAVASRSYDARHKASRASRANKSLLKAANRFYGIEDTEEDGALDESGITETLPSTSSRKRYKDVYDSGSDDGTPKKKRETVGGAYDVESTGGGTSTSIGDGPPSAPQPADTATAPQPADTATATQPADLGGAGDGPSSAPSTSAPGPSPLTTGLGDVEKDTGLVVDEAILPFVRELQSKEAGHNRSGKAWSLMERATLLLAHSRGVADGKGKEQQVRKFLASRTGWEQQRRPALIFLAQLNKLRRQK